MICFKRYLLESNKMNADCMNCNNELNLDIIVSLTTKTFYNNEYRKKRADDLLSRERSLLPDTLARVIPKRKELKALDEQIAEIKEQIRNLKILSQQLTTRQYQLRTGNDYVQQERKQFTMNCPADECRGFLSQAYKCDLCETYFCTACHVAKESRNDDDHKCDPNLVENVKTLKKECKPCPKCSIPIYKWSGCDQMFCTSCYTPFSWNTGKIVTGRIHNPHYYQWQREQNDGQAPRVPGDDPCAALPWYQNVVKQMMRSGQTNTNIYTYLGNCHALPAHIRQVVMLRYPLEDGVQDNEDLREKYLMKEIDEKRWLSLLKARQKRAEKNRAVQQVLEMFITTLTDLFHDYVSGRIENMEEPANALRNYTNRELVKIGRLYQNKVPFIRTDWTMP